MTRVNRYPLAPLHGLAKPRQVSVVGAGISNDEAKKKTHSRVFFSNFFFALTGRQAIGVVRGRGKGRIRDLLLCCSTSRENE